MKISHGFSLVRHRVLASLLGGCLLLAALSLSAAEPDGIPVDLSALWNAEQQGIAAPSGMPPAVPAPSAAPGSYLPLEGPVAPVNHTEELVGLGVCDPAAAAKSKYPTVTVNGVFQADAVMFNQDAASLATFGQIQNGTDFRRARLSAKGALAENMNYFMQMDFGFFGRPTFTDVWTEWTGIPVLGTVRAGQWKHPFSLEVVSSFRYTTFMERSSLFQPFTPFRHMGVGFYNYSEDLNTTWAASLIRTGQDQFGGSLSTNGGNGLVARITHLLWYEDEGTHYFHTGGGYFLNSPPNDTARFRSIPEIFVGEFRPDGTGTSGQAVPGVFDGTPFFVDTLALTGIDHVHTFGLEALWVAGPLSVQAEGMAAIVDHSALASDTLKGSYVQMGYFLTGEHRPYDRKNGCIDRVKPFNNFGRHYVGDGCYQGWGAWEVAGRWSYVDLTDGAINGGTMNNFTFGVNWYQNPYSKVVFNYIHSWLDHRTAVESEANAFGLRVQIDF